MTEETIDERNSMREYRHYDIGSVLVPVPEDALNYWTERIKTLLGKHSKPEIDLWQNID